MAKQKGTTKPSDIPEQVPMFLRKTYHMIDSCDPSIACWSEDGETFIVKDPNKFETQIIPQFFKHSKFTSFVRQLNFYSFRKIKYMDTLRLDPKLEAETANFWRFRHDKFQRGKPNLLTQIKRMTASQSRAAATVASTTPSTPSHVPSSSAAAAAPTQTDKAMQSEIDTLKKQLEEMNKNMNQLTTMVQQVSLNDSDNKTDTNAAPGNKRKKVEFVEEAPFAANDYQLDAEEALDLLMEANPDDMFAAGDGLDLETVSSYPALPSPLPAAREYSMASNATDADFVDQLFSAFGEDESSPDKHIDALVEPEPVGSSSSSLSSKSHQSNTHNNHSRPDAELMDRLSEALAVLPKDMQEQIVNRLIASIMSNNLLGPAPATSAVLVPSCKKEDDDDEDDDMPEAVATPELDAVGMPLAAATLASLLSYYSTLVKENAAEHEQQQASANKPVKSLPVIPCHA